MQQAVRFADIEARVGRCAALLAVAGSSHPGAWSVAHDGETITLSWRLGVLPLDITGLGLCAEEGLLRLSLRLAGLEWPAGPALGTFRASVVESGVSAEADFLFSHAPGGGGGEALSLVCDAVDAGLNYGLHKYLPAVVCDALRGEGTVATSLAGKRKCAGLSPAVSLPDVPTGSTTPSPTTTNRAG